MSRPNMENQTAAWLDALTSAESKRHEAAALAIAKSPTYDAHIIAALKNIAHADAQKYARAAAKNALQKIAEAHFAAGNDIRAYLEQLRLQGDKPQAQTAPVVKPEMPLPVAPAVVAEMQTIEPASSVDLLTPLPVHAYTPAPSQSKPPAPAVPFDQWLLSERNIKLALYSGGLLLLLAGLIFVGINWAYLPGIAKLGVTLGVTAVLYVGGALLFRRPSLKIGGTALLAIASGFLPLNFVVTHLYLTQGSVNGMWLVASVVCGAVYAATALWSRQNLFTVFTLFAIYSAAAAAMGMWIREFPTHPLGYALVTLLVLAASFAARQIARTQFAARTLRIGAHVAAPIVFLQALIAWGFAFINSYQRDWGWSALAAMLVIVILYAADAWRAKSLYARWGAAVTMGVLAVLTCTQLQLASIQTGIVLMILAAGYLVIGKFLQREKHWREGLPLYMVSALLAVLVTLQAAMAYVKTPEHLALALTGDVALLALATYLFRRAELLYAVAWLGIAPVFIAAQIYLHEMVWLGWVMGALMLAYAVTGFAIGRARLRWGGAFLSAAALLSVMTPALLYPNYFALTMGLLAIAILYACFALWLRWQWLLLAAFAVLNLALVSGILNVFVAPLDIARALCVGLVALGVLLTVGGVECKRRGWLMWRAPLYVVAGIDLVLAYLLALVAGEWFVIGLAGIVGTTALAMQWVERAQLRLWKLPALLTGGGALLWLSGLYAVVVLFQIPREFGALAFALAGALYVAVGLWLRNGERAELFGTPLRVVGLATSGCALLAAAVFNVPPVAALTFAVGALTFGADGFVRKQIALLYVGGLFLLGVWAWLMRYFNVSEWQAYAIPLGMYGLLVGWSEMRAGRTRTFQLATLAGLIVLFGSAFYQSLSNWIYAVLLLAESALAFGYGLKTRSRMYVQAAVAALLLNGIAQFGPAFVQLERWLQVGAIGGILLLVGLVALFRRQKLLETRRALTSEWKAWKP